MLGLLGVGAYLLGVHTVKWDSTKQFPGVDYSRQTAVMQEYGRPPGLINTDLRERAAFQTKDETDVRLPYGPNPQSKDVNIYSITESKAYQEGYLKNLKNLQVTTVHSLMDNAFNSPLNNYDQQGHQVQYGGVQQYIKGRFENLNLRPRFSEEELRHNFHIYSGIDERSTYIKPEIK